MLCYVVDFTVFNVLRAILGEPILPKIVSTVTAATLAFIGNRFWTWRDRSRSGLAREYPIFFLANLVGLGGRLSLDQPQLAGRLLAGTHHERGRQHLRQRGQGGFGIIVPVLGVPAVRIPRCDDLRTVI